MMKRIDADDESSLPIRARNRRFAIGIYVAVAAAVNAKLWCLLTIPCKRELNKLELDRSRELATQWPASAISHPCRSCQLS